MESAQDNKKLENRIAFFAISMAFLAWMAVKLPMPALPFLTTYFDAGNQTLKISVTCNLLAFAVSQIFWGPLSDRYGRRVILIIAFTLALFGTVVTMLSNTVSIYIVGRIIEGFAVGSAAPIGRAIMTDKLEKVTMARIYSWYAIAALLPPAIGPVIGGYLLVYIGWRSIFAFFFILALLFVIACIKYMPETNDHPIAKLEVSKIFEKIKTIASTNHFWAHVLCYGFINGYMIAYYAAMPYWYVVQFHLGESVYAWQAFLPIGTYILGSLLTNKLLAFYSLDRMLLIGLSLTIIDGLVMLLIAPFQAPSLISLNAFICVFSFASGIVTPMTNASLMHAFRDKVSELSAMMSGLRVGGAALIVLISTNLPVHYSFFPLAIYTLVISISAFFAYRFFSR